MSFWEFNVNTFEVWIYIGILVITFLLANTLRRKVGFIRKSLVPTAVIGGLLILVVKSILVYIWGKNGNTGLVVKVENMNVFMESITYHGLGIGVIAMSLKPNRREKNKKAQKDIFNAGLVTVNTYLIQAIVGTLTVLTLYFTFFSGLFTASGLLLPLGFGQGTGQALNFGTIFEQNYGFAGGASFGLTIATIGFLLACLVGVFHIFMMKKKGVIQKKEEHEFTSVEQIASPNEVPVTEAVDRMTIQLSLVMFVYFITFLIMYGVEKLDIGNFGTNTLKPLVWGFNFLIGSLLAVVLKVIFKKLRAKNIMTRDYPNDYLLNRISGFMFDLMIIAGAAAIKIEVLKTLIIPLVALSIVGTIITYFYVRKLSYVLFPGYPQEAFVSLFGMLTGTNSTGMILLREVDPNFETPAASNLIYQAFYAIAFGFPLFLLLGYAPQGLSATLISLAIIVVMFGVFNVLLFRDFIFKKKKQVE